MIDAHKMAVAIANEIETWERARQVRIHLDKEGKGFDFISVEITPVGRAALEQTIRRELALNQDDMQPRAAMRVKELEAELKAEQNRLSDDDGYVP